MTNEKNRTIKNSRYIQRLAFIFHPLAFSFHPSSFILRALTLRGGTPMIFYGFQAKTAAYGGAPGALRSRGCVCSCGCSSVGRARASQARGRGFDPRRPLSYSGRPSKSRAALRCDQGSTRVVGPLFQGRARVRLWIPVRWWRDGRATTHVSGVPTPHALRGRTPRTVLFGAVPAGGPRSVGRRVLSHARATGLDG